MQKKIFDARAGLRKKAAMRAIAVAKARRARAKRDRERQTESQIEQRERQGIPVFFRMSQSDKGQKTPPKKIDRK